MKHFIHVFLLTLTTNLHAEPGIETHGGDLLASQFVATAHQIIHNLKTENTLFPHLTQDDIQRLETQINDTEVNTTSKDLVVNGYTKDAIIWRDTDRSEKYTIVLNRKSWIPWVKDKNEFARLVLHEYLRTIGIQDRNYRVSKLFSMPAEIEEQFLDSICQ